MADSEDRAAAEPGGCHHVHHVPLSAEIRTALAVGARYGVPAILEGDAQRMPRQGHTFFVAENDVWLIDAVPAEYLKLIDTRAD
ncbi:2'-phosphotransferase [Burkholderia cenocepacia]|nr:2'-phosphotransferase [Burkholderia cenocepacia]MBR8482261.1 2'-phosphotransferase [Burkholderia cenocepacia]